MFSYVYQSWSNLIFNMNVWKEKWYISIRSCYGCIQIHLENVTFLCPMSVPPMFLHELGSKLPLFPYNIGDGHQPNNRVLYTHYKDSLLKVGGLPSTKKRDNLDHGTHVCSLFSPCLTRPNVCSQRLTNESGAVVS